MVLNAFDLSLGGRSKWTSEFEAGLVSIVSYCPTGAT